MARHHGDCNLHDRFRYATDLIVLHLIDSGAECTNVDLLRQATGLTDREIYQSVRYIIAWYGEHVLDYHPSQLQRGVYLVGDLTPYVEGELLPDGQERWERPLK